MLRELNVVEQRYRAVLEVLSGIPVTEVAERYGVARQTVHRWMSRYQTDGISGLAERSHAPKRHPWQIPAQVEAVICDLRRTHRRWGPRRLVFELDRRGYPGLSRSTVYRVLVRHQLIEPVPRRKRREQYRRWERPAPMLLWQVDVTASLFLADGRECKIVTGVDDHSRFCVIAAVVLRANARVVCLALVEAMRTYGVPQEILTDNGSVFTGRFMRPRPPCEVLFDRICRENGITHLLTKVASPTTTGKIERLHQTLQRELLDVHGPFATLEDAQAAVDAWRETTTPTGRTSRWRWRSRRPGSSRPPARCWACGSRPNWPSHRLPRLSPLLPRHLRKRHQPPCPALPGRWLGTRWNWTGWSRRRGTCGWLASRSGWAQRWLAGRCGCGLGWTGCTC